MNVDDARPTSSSVVAAVVAMTVTRIRSKHVGTTSSSVVAAVVAMRPACAGAPPAANRITLYCVAPATGAQVSRLKLTTDSDAAPVVVVAIAPGSELPLPLTATT